MMKTTEYRIQKLIDAIREHLMTQLSYDEKGALRFIDPNDKEEISAHYAVSHLSASCLMTANKNEDDTLYSEGKKLLTGLLDRWDEEHRLPAYHFDFNNFALIICHDYLIENDTIRDRIKDIVIKSPDSPHDTINWLPMRLFVNDRRFQWTHNEKYRTRMKRCTDLISKATNTDGGIEDRLPKGISFNLQYDISTLATICLAPNLMPGYDINKGLNFLLKQIAPDGDINYQGRGCNQIFAWGPWIYLLSSFGLTTQLREALDYLEDRLLTMIKNDSMMLNDWSGSEKYLWWDYHYASVYTAHVLFWLMLAIKDSNRLSDTYSPTSDDSHETGLYNVRTDRFFISLFEGRSEYLPEYGPSISLIWTKQNGVIFKGMFAPWRGLFGNKNSFDDIALLNYLGLFLVDKAKTHSLKNKLIHKFIGKRREEVKYVKKPLFCPLKIEYDEKSVSIIWTLEKEFSAFINIPSFCESHNIKLQVDEIEHKVFSVAKFRNQYNWLYLNQSRILQGKVWKVIISL